MADSGARKDHLTNALSGPAQEAVKGEPHSALDLDAGVHRQKAELEKRARELSILLRIAQMAASSLESSALAQAVLNEVIQAFDAEVGAIFVRDDETGFLRMLGDFGLSPGFVQAFQAIPFDHPNALPARVARTGESLLVEDTAYLSSAVLPEFRAELPRMGLIAPLRARNSIIGTLAIGRLSDHPFTAQDLSLLTIVGQLIGVAIENAYLFARTQQQVQELSFLVDLSARLNSAYGIEETAEIALEAACALVKATQGALFLLDASRQVLQLGAHYHLPAQTVKWLQSQRLPLTTGLFQQVAEQARLVEISDATTEPRCQYAPGRTLREACYLPLQTGSRVIGILELEARLQSERVRRILYTLGDMAAVAIERARLISTLQHYADGLEAQVAARTEDLQRALARAQEADRLKSVFLSTISHELRTPLAAIKGFASTLLQEDVEWDPTTQREFLSIIERESDQLERLISQLLDISRLEAGILNIEQVACSLSEIVQGVASRLKVIARAHELQVHIPLDLPLVYADRQRIGQVLSNLVENAAKYAPPHTAIVISASAVEDQVQVSVSDQGAGIPPELRERIFDRFFRADPRDGRPGTGLGLAICQGIVEAHGGRIWVEGKPGQGSVFVFTLPIAQGPNGRGEGN
ncbi:MAG: ATP-binding protein [Anaerolineae bacterium]|nr:ATP-binding protein [Anaerolineae bacterium]